MISRYRCVSCLIDAGWSDFLPSHCCDKTQLCKLPSAGIVPMRLCWLSHTQNEHLIFCETDYMLIELSCNCSVTNWFLLGRWRFGWNQCKSKQRGWNSFWEGATIDRFCVFLFPTARIRLTPKVAIMKGIHMFVGCRSSESKRFEGKNDRNKSSN